jgi:hypothetical protein
MSPPQKIAANGPLEKIFMFFESGNTPQLAFNRFGGRTRRPQLLFRNPRVFQQERLHISDDEARVERSRTVDISDATFPID